LLALLTNSVIYPNVIDIRI